MQITSKKIILLPIFIYDIKINVFEFKHQTLNLKIILPMLKIYCAKQRIKLNNNYG